MAAPKPDDAPEFLSKELRRAQNLIHDLLWLVSHGQSETAMTRCGTYWEEWTAAYRAAVAPPKDSK